MARAANLKDLRLSPRADTDGAEPRVILRRTAQDSGWSDRPGGSLRDAFAPPATRAALSAETRSGDHPAIRALTCLLGNLVEERAARHPNHAAASRPGSLAGLVLLARFYASWGGAKSLTG